MRTIITAGILVLILFPLFAEDSKMLLNKGKEQYNQKNNKEAKKLLEESLSLEETGEGCYYLGNVLMNLCMYDSAIEYYYKSVAKKYDVINCYYNIACAYSLKNDNEKAFFHLMDALREGDRYPKRVDIDSDLDSFRKTKFYKKYKKILSLRREGFTPKNANEILAYLNSLGDMYCPGGASAGNIYFYNDGTFQQGGPGGIGLGWFYGEWKIDEQRQVFIIKKLFGVTSKTKMDLYGNKKYTQNDYYKNNPNMIIFKRFYEVDEIPFSEIRLDCVDIVYESNNNEQVLNFNQFGKNISKNKVLNYTWGQRISVE
jgi:hypothetical protein